MSSEPNSGPTCGGDTDSITLSKLQLDVVAPTVWGGQPKPQPALLSLTLILRSGFHSAAGKDALDDNTINYGDLAKRLRTQCADKPTLEALFPRVKGLCAAMARREDGSCRLVRSMVVVKLPQASMCGEGSEIMEIVEHAGDGGLRSEGWIFAVREVKVMVLIGLKVEERVRRQPVVADLDVNVDDEEEKTEEGVARRNQVLFGLEEKLVEIIQDTKFGTLEALAEFTVEKLEDHLINAKLPCTRFHLGFSKRRVIDFAEGPKVDVSRVLRGKKTKSATTDLVAGESVTTKSPTPLRILKPYV